MISNNHIVSVRQMKRLLVLDLFSGTSLILPIAVTRLSGRMGIWAILAGAIASIVYVCLLLNLGTCYTCSYPQFCKEMLGKWGAGILMGIYSVKYLLAAALLMGVFAQIVNHTFLTDIPKAVLGLGLLVVCMYCVYEGLETRARLGEILIFFVIVPIVMIILLALPQVHLDYLWPIDFAGAGGSYMKDSDFTGGTNGFLASAAVVFSLYSVVEWLLFLRPNVRKMEASKRGAWMSIVWPTVLCLFVTIVCIGIFSVEAMNEERWPTVTLMQIVRFPGGFLSRQDGLMLAFWMIGMFILTSGHLNYGMISLKSVVTKMEDHRWMLLIPAGLVFTAFLEIYLQDATKLYVMYMMFVFAPLGLLTPLFLRLIARFKRRPLSKNRSCHQKVKAKGFGRGENA